MTPTPKQQRYYRSLRKLTDQQIRDARLRYQNESPKPTIERLAQIYNVSTNCMWRALRSPQYDQS